MRDHVELISSGVKKVSANTLTASNGEEREVDAIIFGTGFYVSEFPNLFTVKGLGGKDLFKWYNEVGPEGYYGISITGFPNLAVLVGANTGLGHNSIIHMMESQYNYIMDYYEQLKAQKDDRAYFDLKPEVQERFNKDLQQRLSKMVWSEGGCSS